MSDQRRYTSSQVKRVVDSGERSADDNNDFGLTDFLSAGPVGYGLSKVGLYDDYKRLQSNVRASIPRSFTDLYSIGGLIGPAIKAASSSDVDFDEAMFGEQGLKEIGDYANERIAAYEAKLPAEKRTPENREKIKQAVMNSRKTKDFILSKAPTMYRQGTEAGNAINQSLGLNRVDEETTTDEIEQIAGSALIPLPGGVGARIGRRFVGDAIDSTVGKIATNAAELALPGTSPYSGGRIAANTAVGGGLTQGLRALTDQPSVVTGDAFAADNGVDIHTDPIDDDDEPGSGLNSEQLLASAAGMGGILFGIAAAMGKGQKVAAKEVADAASSVEDEVVEKAVDAAADKELKPVLGTAQKVTARASDRNAPMRDIAKKAYDEAPADVAREATDQVTYAASEANSANVQSRFENFADSGDLDGLDQPTIPLRVIQRAAAELTPEERVLYQRGSISKSLIERRYLAAKSLADEINDLRNERSLAGRDKERYTNLSSQIGQRVQKLKQLEADVEEGRFEINDISTAEARTLSAEFDSNPKLVNLANMQKRIYADLQRVAEKQGLVSAADTARMNAAHNSYMPFQRDPMAGKTGLSRYWEQVKEVARDTPNKPREGVRTPFLMRQMDFDADRIAKSSELLDPVAAQADYSLNFIRNMQTNNAIRQFVDGIRGTSMDGVAVKRLYEPMTIEQAVEKGLYQKHAGKDKIVTYMDGGNVHFIETADPDLAKALHFSAPQVINALNSMRKIWQQGTTGIFAPYFALKSAEYEYQIAKITRRPGRSFGAVDQLVRQSVMNFNAVEQVMDRITDPSFRLQQLAAIGRQVSAQATRQLGRKIAEDLSMQSGFFSAMANVAGGKQFLEGMSKTMVQVYNDSTFAVFAKSGISNANFLDDPMSGLRADYGSLLEKFPLGKNVGNAKSMMLHSYHAMLESVHNSAKYAFFAQNYSILKKKHNGKIPKKALDQLVFETKSLSGDMTSVAGSDKLTKLYSSMPYSQIAATSMRYVGQQIRDYPDHIASRLLTGLVAPTALGISMMAANEETWDWYWNKLPSWQRISTLPVIKPSWWLDFMSGSERPLRSTDVMLTTVAPELVPIVGTTMSGLRALGLFGKEANEFSSFRNDFSKSMEAVAGLAMPPAFSFMAALGGVKFDPMGNVLSAVTGSELEPQTLYQDRNYQGAFGSQTNRDSDFSQYSVDLLSSLFGTSIGIGASMVDTFNQTLDETGEFTKAVSQAFDYGMYEAENRVPSNPATADLAPGLWTGGKRRSYVTNSQRDYVKGVMNKWGPIADQISQDKDKRNRNATTKQLGIELPSKIADPRARALAEEMRNVLGRGQMKKINQQIADNNAQLARLEASKDTIAPDRYHKLKNHITIQVQKLVASQATMIKGLEANIKQKYKGDLDQAFEFVIQSIKQ